MLFGRKSEKLLRQIEQLELELEEAYISEGERQEKREAQPAANPAVRQPRQPLPDHLPREAKEHLPEDTPCPNRGGAWKRPGENGRERLEPVRAGFHFWRTVRTP